MVCKIGRGTAQLLALGEHISQHFAKTYYEHFICKIHLFSIFIVNYFYTQKTGIKENSAFYRYKYRKVFC